jgi:hypothetical protein
MLIITILSFGCNLWQCYFWVVFLQNVLLVIKVKVCDALLLKVKFVSFCGFNGLLAFADWVYKVILKLIWDVQFLWLIKALLNFFVKHSKVILHLMLAWYTVWSTAMRHTKNHKWYSCFSLWIEPGASNWNSDVPGVLRHWKHWLCIANYNSQLPIVPLEPFF